MQPIRQLFALLFFIGIMAFSPAQAETYHTCGTIIASAPAVITTQGVYCLTHDLSTSVTSGFAIQIQTNNVVIDCNGYKIGGLAGGSGSLTSGVSVDTSRLNITVRNCGIRGYFYGINLQGSGNLVEDNRLDNNLYAGIQVQGDNNRIQRNRVYDTGGSIYGNLSVGIDAYGDVIDNTVANVFSNASDSFSFGIQEHADGAAVRGNQVRDTLVNGTGNAIGIAIFSGGVSVRANDISVTAATTGTGIVGNGATDTFCIGNTVHKFSTAIAACQMGTDNLSN